ncbi:hypothetical protein DBR17_04290 [Sphingomonas sp. HMWF008]|nr:hypothetical protein DBR17_04290 [Sphingomonas sp. HMWF008]
MCTIVPSLIFGILLGQWGTNLIWGHVFGFGWFLAQTYYGPEGWRIAAALGVFVWPPIILLALFWISGIIWRSGNANRRRAFAWTVALSCLPVVPAQTVAALYSGVRVPADFNMLWNGY